MSQLQKLLDERYPITVNMSDTELFKMCKYREIFGAAYEMAFIEGYNARVAEEATPAPNNPEYDLKKVLDECRKLIAEGRPIAAIRLYKDTMGGSITEAKAILNL